MLRSVPELRSELRSVSEHRSELRSDPELRSELRSVSESRSELRSVPELRSELRSVPESQVMLRSVPGQKVKLGHIQNLTLHCMTNDGDELMSLATKAKCQQNWPKWPPRSWECSARCLLAAQEKKTHHQPRRPPMQKHALRCEICTHMRSMRCECNRMMCVCVCPGGFTRQRGSGKAPLEHEVTGHRLPR